MPLTVLLRSAESLVLLLLPSGGQAVARRNAWAGMSADARRGRERRQADQALAAAAHRAHRVHRVHRPTLRRGGTAT